MTILDVGTATTARRTQAERTAETRGRLLDAAVESLVERGWAGTSTVEVARRAGVSRGAQLHHFPTKADLVLGALQHLYDRRIAEFRDAMAVLPPGTHPGEAAVDLLWSFVNGPTFVACLELVVAARTDADLHARLVELEDRFVASCQRVFDEVFPAGDPVVPRFAFALLEGLALHRIAGRPAAEADDVLEALKFLARTLLPAT